MFRADRISAPVVTDPPLRRAARRARHRRLPRCQTRNNPLGIGPGATVARQVLAVGLALLRDLGTQIAGAELGPAVARHQFATLTTPPADLPGRWALAGQDESADKRHDGGIRREGCAAP